VNLQEDALWEDVRGYSIKWTLEEEGRGVGILRTSRKRKGKNGRRKKKVERREKGQSQGRPHWYNTCAGNDFQRRKRERQRKSPIKKDNEN